jgi:hypothetical protein
MTQDDSTDRVVWEADLNESCDQTHVFDISTSSSQIVWKTYLHQQKRRKKKTTPDSSQIISTQQLSINLDMFPMTESEKELENINSNMESEDSLNSRINDEIQTVESEIIHPKPEIVSERLITNPIDQINTNTAVPDQKNYQAQFASSGNISNNYPTIQIEDDFVVTLEELERIDREVAMVLLLLYITIL